MLFIASFSVIFFFRFASKRECSQKKRADTKDGDMQIAEIAKTVAFYSIMFNYNATELPFMFFTFWIISNG